MKGKTMTSTNPTVANALAARGVAANASPDILAYVRRAPYAQAVGKSGNTIHYTSTDFRREDREQIRRKVEDYLAKRVNLAACQVFFGPDADPDDIHDSETFLRVEIPLSAVRNSSVAANAGVKSGNYQVTIETVDFSGNRTQSKNMTAAQLKTWLALVHCDGSDRFLDEIAAAPRQEVWFNLDMHPTVTVKAM